jgi:uncharacterized secreted protein with C-terminal beta-propeller domain
MTSVDASQSNKNIQVNGVDEPDRIALSANGLVFLRSDEEFGQIMIFDTSDPNDLRKIATISTGMYAPQLHHAGNRLIVVGQPAYFHSDGLFRSLWDYTLNLTVLPIR